jgi:hypothetical protein
MPKVLTKIEIEEISLVDQAANDGALVKLAKSDSRQAQDVLKSAVAGLIAKCKDPTVPAHVTLAEIAKLGRQGVRSYHLNEALEQKLLKVLAKNPAMTRGDAWARVLQDEDARSLRECAKRLPGPAVRPAKPVEKISLEAISPSWAKIQVAAKALQQERPGLGPEAARAAVMKTPGGEALRQKYYQEVKEYWNGGN